MEIQRNSPRLVSYILPKQTTLSRTSSISQPSTQGDLQSTEQADYVHCTAGLQPSPTSVSQPDAAEGHVK